MLTKNISVDKDRSDNFDFYVIDATKTLKKISKKLLVLIFFFIILNDI